jgi:hypothetical protein
MAVSGSRACCPTHPTGAINQAPTSHAMNCVKKIMNQVSAMRCTLDSLPITKKDARIAYMYCMKKRQFIASVVGTRFIASAGVGMGCCPDKISHRCHLSRPHLQGHARKDDAESCLASAGARRDCCPYKNDP